MRENGLEPYTLSADALRMAYASPILEVTGRLRVPGDNDRTVWQQLFTLLESRMLRGEFVIVDATHTHPRSFQNYQQIAQKHRYQVICVDFSNVPFETCLERNNQREEPKVVPPLEMQRMANNMTRTRIPQWITLVPALQLLDTLALTPTDVSNYTAINHIGDIQGCFDTLVTYFETYGIHDDQLYIFVGDYLDRGPQNAEVMQWLLDNYHRPNFVFIEGNHEAHLRSWTRNVPARSREFNLRTKPQLEDAGISPKKVHGFMYGLREMFLYTFHGTTVLVSHGGLSRLPENPVLIPSIQYIKGAGLHEEADQSDASFAQHAAKNVYQIHGHRNRYNSPTRVNEHCFNLEGKVEFSGELRTVTLTTHDWEERPITSTIDASDMIVESVGVPLASRIQGIGTLVENLRNTPGIYEKPQDNTHISSFNFTRDVFYKKTWDNLNLHARGLFINTATNTIVARAYEKFFNLGERPETQPDNLHNALTFPVKVWLKENGYLGLVGYDSESNELVFASKSSLTSEFAGWLTAQFEHLAPAGTKQRREIELYLQSGKTLVFEVIEPQLDPHIIEYQTPHLVLLDIVHNQPYFEAEDAKERARIAKQLGCTSKQLACELKDYAALEGWLAAVKQFDYTFNGSPVEGFVLEDARDFKVKIKLPWYAFWRQMRTQLERAQAGKKTQLPSLAINNDLAEQFLAFMATKSAQELKQTDICRLRTEFEQIQ